MTVSPLSLVVIVLAVLLGYAGSAFMEPPNFAGLRWIAVLILALPGLYYLARATQEFIADRVFSEEIRNRMIGGALAIATGAGVAWLVYPQVHARYMPTGGWTWNCSNRGCEWTRGPAPTPLPKRR